MLHGTKSPLVARPGVFSLCLVGLATITLSSLAVEDDYEFMPTHAWRFLGSMGGDDVSLTLAEGFPGHRVEPKKNRWIAPVDGDGGFDNVAPRLAAEEGPGGLEWDPSPTYRTRYKNGTNYLPNSTRLQGNNWFTRIPYAEYDSTNDVWVIRFDANMIRYFDVDSQSSTVYWGRYGNSRSKLVKSGTSPNGLLKLSDAGGKVYTFSESESYKCTKIEPVGIAETTITYATNTITVIQKSNSSTEVRKFTYTLTDHGNGKRIDKIEVAEKDGTWGSAYRTIDFTYHEQVTSPAGSSTGDLVGIEETMDLSESGKTYSRKWVFKYYTGSYNAQTNPGNPYQIEAILEPGAVHGYESANPTHNIYEKSVTDLANYVDRTYEYHSDRRLKELTLNDNCGCGGSSGTYTYSWVKNGTTPTDLDTWFSRVTITLPTSAGHFIDYNKYGQILNSMIQEDIAQSGSRKWIRTYRRDDDGFLTDSYSVAACDSYNTTTHIVTTNTTGGMHYQYDFTYDSGDDDWTLTAKLRDPGSGDWNWQAKRVFTLKTSGDRRRFFQDSETIYPTETTTDSGDTTSFAYETFHTLDALAVARRKMTFPVVPTGENGSGNAVSIYDYFELDSLHTWTKDGEGHVDYMGYDGDRRTETMHVTDIDTDSADRPAGVPAPPDTTFNSSSGLNIVTKDEYDVLGRVTKSESAAFDAWNGTSVTSTKITKRWHYDKLSGDELVIMEYPHIDSSYHHAAISLQVIDHDGNAATSAMGELDTLKRDTTLSDDLDDTEATIEDAFEGTIVQRRDSTYDGSKVLTSEVWSDASSSLADKHITTYTYDSSGRLETTKNPAGTITRYTYDVLGRTKITEIGTVDSGPTPNMTATEKLFYDDEEDTSSNVGDGFLTSRVRYTKNSLTEGLRTTDHDVDYRGRVTTVFEPLDVSEDRTYDNLDRLTLIERYDDGGQSSVLMRKTENFYDPLGQAYEVRNYGITGGSGSDYSKTAYWHDARGLNIKTLSNGKVFKKTQYDGAGRAINRATSYDAGQDESAYSAADDLDKDTVIQESVYTRDASGRVELEATYERRHGATGEGSLTVGTSGNGRAQYVATWFDEFGRSSCRANYGTNGGTDLTTRPTGSPPATSDANRLVTETSYTVKGEVEEQRGPAVKTPASEGLVVTHRYEYTDWGATSKRIDNYVNGTPGVDDDRTTVYTYDSVGRLQTITAKATTNDQVTENVYGVTRGSGDADSRIASNDLIKTVKHPDPSNGGAGGVNDQVHYAYNAQGQRTYMEDQRDTAHVYEYDDRGRVIHDRVTVLGDTGVDGAIRRISWIYDALDRTTRVRSYDNASTTSGTIKNEVHYVYDKFGVVKTIYQEWNGSVDLGFSNKVSYAYSFPTNGTTGLRQTSTTYPSGAVITNVYDSGIDDTISRVSGKKKGSDWLFEDDYLGLGRLVKRRYAGSDTYWTLEGTDSANADNYVGLDRFGRIDDLVVIDGTTNVNRYLYAYNDRSQITYREDEVGNVSGSYEFDQQFTYDGLGRLTEHERGEELDQTPTHTSHECWTLNRSGGWEDYYEGLADPCGTGVSCTLNSSNEITDVDSVDYSYDRAGNMTERGSDYDLIFDAWSRLVEVKDGAVTVSKYAYNGIHQKISSGEYSSLEYDYYYSNNNQVVEEWYRDDDDYKQWYAWGTQDVDDIVVRSTGSTSSYFKYYVLDANLNVVTRLGSTGAPISRYVYYSYGEPKQLSSNWTTWQTITEDHYLFTGRQYHRRHGAYDYRARFRDAEIGGFVQRDPIGSWGDEENWGNGYMYVASDPANLRDGKGLWSTSDHEKLTNTTLDHLTIRELFGGWGWIGRCKERITDDLHYYNERQDSSWILGPVLSPSRHFMAPYIVSQKWMRRRYIRYVDDEMDTLKEILKNSVGDFGDDGCWRFNNMEKCTEQCSFALRSLGYLLHSYQDYYGHSTNWISGDNPLRHSDASLPMRWEPEHEERNSRFHSARFSSASLWSAEKISTELYMMKTGKIRKVLSHLSLLCCDLSSPFWPRA